MSYSHSLGWEHSIWVFLLLLLKPKAGDLHYTQLSGLCGQHNPYYFPLDFLLATPLTLVKKHCVPPFPCELHRAEHGSLTPNKLSPGIIPQYPLLHPSIRQGKRCQSCHCHLLPVILVVVSLCCYSVLHLAAPNFYL